MALTDNTITTPAAPARDCKTHSVIYVLAAGADLATKIAADAALAGAVPVSKKATISVQVQICIEPA